MAETPRGLHRYAVFLAGAIVLLIAAGALVKSKEAGLSVPDWPLSYGGLNPPRWWQIENVRAEHGHRLIAGTVALLTVGLAVWAARREPRRVVRLIAWGAVVAVLVQAALGGVTVLFFLPPAVSISHAGLAQLFLCLVVSVAVLTSPAWSARGTRAPALGGLRLLTAGTTVVIYLQVLLGAVMRHYGAGLAIPDFPLAFGRLVPPRFDFAVGIHYAHRVGALVVTLAIAATVARVWSQRRAAILRVPAAAMAVLVVLQVTLGATVVLSRKAVVPNTLHVAVGAALLATSLVVTLLCWRGARNSVAVSPGPVEPAAA